MAAKRGGTIRGGPWLRGFKALGAWCLKVDQQGKPTGESRKQGLDGRFGRDECVENRYQHPDGRTVIWRFYHHAQSLAHWGWDAWHQPLLGQQMLYDAAGGLAWEGRHETQGDVGKLLEAIDLAGK